MSRRCRSLRRLAPAVAIAVALAAALGSGARQPSGGVLLTLGGRVPVTIAIGPGALQRAATP